MCTRMCFQPGFTSHMPHARWPYRSCSCSCSCSCCPQVRDLRRLLEMYQRWQRRLFPHCSFQDFQEKLEKLGVRSETQVGSSMAWGGGGGAPGAALLAWQTSLLASSRYHHMWVCANRMQSSAAAQGHGQQGWGTLG
jgi:hypothetical protein